MKTNDEIFNLVISRRDEHKAEMKKRVNLIAAVTVFAACVCVACSIAAARIKPQKSPPAPAYSTEEIKEERIGETSAHAAETAQEQNTEQEINQNENTGKTQQKNEKTVTGKEAVSDRAGAPEKKPDPASESPESVTEAKKSGNIGDNGFFIPVVPEHAGAPSGVEITGEKITDSEAKAYFDENKASVVSALAASGVPADDIKISEKGYSHIGYYGVEGKRFELRQNFRDYPVYNGTRLVAIITLVKENGRLYSTPAFGAPWFDSYGAYLNAHKGQKLLYVYAGPTEIVIAPDGTYRSPAGNDVSQVLEGVDEPYQYFYCEGATFTP